MSSKRFAGEVIWGSCALGFNETCFGFCVFAFPGGKERAVRHRHHGGAMILKQEELRKMRQQARAALERWQWFLASR